MREKPNEEIVFSDFQKGIADSAHVGFQDMRNVDIHSTPGAVLVNPSLVKGSSTNVTDLPKWIVQDPASGEQYAIGDTGKVYKATGSWPTVAGYSTTSAAGNGLAIWKDYLFVARNSKLDVYGPLSGAAAWTLDWQTWTGAEVDSQFHPMIIGQDDILYIGAGQYISSLAETDGSTFAPGTSSTYTFSNRALDLPKYYKVKCLEELGTKLMIGTWQGTSINDIRVADIFPWDRVSTSVNLPIRFNTNGIHQMKNINNVLFVTAGLHGEVYLTDGSTTKLLRKIPASISGADTAPDNYYNFFPGACAVTRGRYYFAPSASQLTSGIGVWSVDFNGTLVFENQISTGTTSSASPLQIGVIAPAGGYNLRVGWRDNTTYGIDSTTTGTKYAAYEAYVTTPLKRVGTYYHKRTFTEIEAVFNRPLIASQGVKLYYRKNLVDGFTLIGTIDFTTYGAVQDFPILATIADATSVQIRAALAANGSASPELMELRLR